MFDLRSYIRDSSNLCDHFGKSDGSFSITYNLGSLDKMCGSFWFLEGPTSSEATRLEMFPDLLDPLLPITVLSTTQFCFSHSNSHSLKGRTLEG